MNLAAASESAIRVEGDATLDSARGGWRCSMKFLDADVKRPLASLSAIIDEGNKGSFGSTESCMEPVTMGNTIPMCRKKCALILRLDAQPSTKPSRSVTFDGPADEREPGEPGFRWQA